MVLSDFTSKGEDDSWTVKRRAMGTPPHAVIGLKGAVPALFAIQQYKLEEFTQVMFVVGEFFGKSSKD